MEGAFLQGRKFLVLAGAQCIKSNDAVKSRNMWREQGWLVVALL